VRVFFRLFKSQTTATLTYNGGSGDGYPKTAGAAPIAQWLSFPCFSQDRNANRDLQEDTQNVRTIDASESEEFFGVLLDNNLDVNYLPSMPGGGGAQPLAARLVA
jgi:hypothetical protein